MGKWVSKQGRMASRKSSQKNHRAYGSVSEEEMRSRANVKSSSGTAGPNSVLFQNPSSVTCLDCSSDKYCLSGSSDGTILLQDLDQGKIVSQTLGHSKEVTKVKLGKQDSSCYITASRDKTVKIWKSTDSQSAKGELIGHSLSVTAVDCDSQLKTIWSGSRDNTLCLWDVETQNCIQECKISRNLITDLCFIEELNLVIQTSEDRIVKLWDGRNLEVIHSFPIQGQIQMSCAVSGHICSTTNNGFGNQGCEISIWDLRERTLLQTLRGHHESTTASQFLGQDLISCSHDGTLKLWKEKQGNFTNMSTLHLSSGNLTCLSLLSKNTVLAGSFDNGILMAHVRNDQFTL